MVNGCVVSGCNSRSNDGKKRSYFSIPAIISNQGEQAKELSSQRRNAWINSIRRKDWQPSKHSRVCSKHFTSGKPSAAYKINHPDWAPTVQMGGSNLRKTKPRTAIHSIMDREDKRARYCTAQSLLDLSVYNEPSPQSLMDPPDYNEPSPESLLDPPDYNEPSPESLLDPPDYNAPSPESLLDPPNYNEPSPESLLDPPDYNEPSPESLLDPPDYNEPSPESLLDPPVYNEPSPEYDIKCKLQSINEPRQVARRYRIVPCTTTYSKSLLTKKSLLKPKVSTNILELKPKVLTDVLELKPKVLTDVLELKHKVLTDALELKPKVSTDVLELKPKVSTDVLELKHEVSTDVLELKPKVLTDVLELKHKKSSPTSRRRKLSSWLEKVGSSEISLPGKSNGLAGNL